MTARDECRQLVLQFFDGNEEKTDLWFKTPNPLLGGITPSFYRLWSTSKLLKFIKQQLRENEK